MSVKYEDYYKTLGVSRTASADEIQQAYRSLARKFHPDVNKEKSAEARFKLVNEAYEVLKDPDKRKRYDALGENWKAGQDFRPPPGWEGVRSASGRRARNVEAEDIGGFSDFFDAIFGGGFGQRPGGAWSTTTSPRHGPQRRAQPEPGQDVEAEITVSLADVFHGATRRIELQAAEADDRGRPAAKSIHVKIPAGAADGNTIRLAGQGRPSPSGGPPGDLLLRVRVAPDPRFEMHGSDLKTILPITPAEAVLGGKVTVPLFDSEAMVTIPPGSQSGQKLRLRGKGLPKRSAAGERGDTLVELRIVVPKDPTPEERALYEQLATISNFAPRGM
jgi:curved DNA-binding protein